MSVKAEIAKYLLIAGVGVGGALSGGYLIFPFEGENKDRQGNHVVYADPVGIPTACWGLTGTDLYGKRFKVGDKYSQKECLAMFVPVLKSFEQDVRSRVRVPFSSDYQEAALISFTYNVGGGSLQTSTLLREINKGNHEFACDQLSRWVYAQRVKLNGLVTRRDEEKAWCMGDVPYEVTVTHSVLIDMVMDTYYPDYKETGGEYWSEHYTF